MSRRRASHSSRVAGGLSTARSRPASALIKLKYSRCRSFGVWAKSAGEIARSASVHNTKIFMRCTSSSHSDFADSLETQAYFSAALPLKGRPMPDCDWVRYKQIRGQALPEQIVFHGNDYALDCLFKHDFYAAT